MVFFKKKIVGYPVYFFNNYNFRCSVFCFFLLLFPSLLAFCEEIFLDTSSCSLLKNWVLDAIDFLFASLLFFSLIIVFLTPFLSWSNAFFLVDLPVVFAFSASLRSRSLEANFFLIFFWRLSRFRSSLVFSPSPTISPVVKKKIFFIEHLYQFRTNSVW